MNIYLSKNNSLKTQKFCKDQAVRTIEVQNWARLHLSVLTSFS